MAEINEKDQEFDEVVNDEIRTEVVDDDQPSSGKGIGLLIVGGALALGGLVVTGVKAIKNRKEANADKPKTRLKLCRVPVDDGDIDGVFKEDLENDTAIVMEADQ